jgi:hypothetical protein
MNCTSGNLTSFELVLEPQNDPYGVFFITRTLLLALSFGSSGVTTISEHLIESSQ